MASSSEQYLQLQNQINGLSARQTGLSASGQIYAFNGEHIAYGCKVTEGDSATDMIVALEGAASGDSARLNPELSLTPAYQFEYPNIAGIKSGGFYSLDLTATVDAVPATGLGRYDIAYIYVGPTGPGLAIATGTPGAGVKTSFDADGLDTSAYDSGTDVALPVGAYPVARIYVEDAYSGVANARIADLRVFGLTAADLVDVENAVAATAADAAQTALDRIATGEDAVATAADAVSTAADVVSTNADAVATAADRVQTGIDATTATTKATEAAASAAAAAAIVDIDSVAIYANPKAFSQGIHLTSSSSLGGVRLIDDVEVNFGTSDLSLSLKMSLEDWTSSTASYLFYKYEDNNNYIALYIATDYTIRFIAVVGGVTVMNIISTASISIADFVCALIGVAITRETASSAGNAIFTVDGVQLGAAVSIAAAATVSLDNSGDLYVFGSNSDRPAAISNQGVIYNRALSVPESLDLCINGVSFADKGASNVNRLSANDASFASAGNWVAGENCTLTPAYDSGDAGHSTTLRVLRTSNGNCYFYLPVAYFSPELGKRYKLKLNYKIVQNTELQMYTNSVGGVNIPQFSVAATTWTEYSAEVVITNAAGIMQFYLGIGGYGDSGNEMLLDDVEFLQIGATIQLEPEDIQPSPGQWFDSSGNGNHAKLPASGASLMRPLREFEIRWTNTWAGTQETQYLGGVNETILPSGNIYIETWDYSISGTVIEDVKAGDGSDDDRFVVNTTGLAAGLGRFTLANNRTDLTNRKATLKPDANFTGSIASTIKGYILE